MVFLFAVIALSPSFASIDVFERRLTCAHLLQGAETLHHALVEARMITPLEAERTVIVPGFEARPTRIPLVRRFRPFRHLRGVAVAIKPSGDAVVLQLGGAETARPRPAKLATGTHVVVPWFGVLAPAGGGDLAWTAPLEVLPLGDVTRRALYDRFKDVLDEMVKTGRLRVDHIRRARVLEGRVQGRAVKVLRTWPESDAEFLVFDESTGLEFAPPPGASSDPVIDLKDGRRLSLARNRWGKTWPRGVAGDLAAAAKFPSWGEFLAQFPEAVENLPNLPFVARDVDYGETYVQPATDERDGSHFLLVILRRRPRHYGETPARSYGLWDPRARAWVDVVGTPSRTLRLANRRRVGLNVDARAGWSDLPPVSEYEGFAREF